MNRSESIIELIKALSAFQAEVGNAGKTSSNPFFHSKYADLAEVWNTVREAKLAEHGFAFIQMPSFSPGPDGTGIVDVESTLAHVSGEWIGCTTSCPLFPTINRAGALEPVNAQDILKATTYLRRQSLAAILGIAQEDDDGNSAARRDMVQVPQPQAAPNAREKKTSPAKMIPPKPFKDQIYENWVLIKTAILEEKPDCNIKDELTSLQNNWKEKHKNSTNPEEDLVIEQAEWLRLNRLNKE